MATANKEYIVDMFDEIVTRTRSSYDLENGLEPYYDYGHILDILAKLSNKDRHDIYKFQKYPLICLITDIEQNISTEQSILYEFSPRILILAQTNKNYTSQERTENIFKNILYPIYNQFIIDLANYEHFDFKPTNYIPHSKTDRYSWGASGVFGNIGVIFNDYLDGIELIFNSIKVKRYSKSNCNSLNVN